MRLFNILAIHPDIRLQAVTDAWALGWGTVTEKPGIVLISAVLGRFDRGRRALRAPAAPDSDSKPLRPLLTSFAPGVVLRAVLSVEH